MASIASVEAVIGAGLSGDRYCAGVGFYSPRPTEPGAREVTLIEAETLERLQREHGLALAPTDHRRNITTRGVRLRELLNQRFHIGEVVLEGVRDCPPCEHLESLLGKPVMRPLLESGGIRARVVGGGTLRVGAAITVAQRPTPAGLTTS
jgi:MOSC domain-containing protein YiiM